ncbi:MAG: prepilin-type N-terminal cleavage/methylation domain-containing protein [Deltaproteobacteria bacterium]|nr:prepilin-type N-terminal cleavage/methylation domain-containing protein [Deltaproteobacteria bacterium]
MTSTLLARRARGGFTLVEVMVASAILGASLIVMFGFHSQAVRSNMNARRLTDCTYLAQTQMERVLAMDWTDGAGRPSDIAEGYVDDASMALWDPLTSNLGTDSDASPLKVNAAFEYTDDLGPTLYTITWDVEDMDDDGTWIRVRVRCTYDDAAFDTKHGTTISTYRFRDA